MTGHAVSVVILNGSLACYEVLARHGILCDILMSEILHWYIALKAALIGLVVSALATGPMGLVAVGSGLAEDGGFLWVIKIHSVHFLQRGGKAVGPIL
jgi:hypothetical protein